MTIPTAVETSHPGSIGPQRTLRKAWLTLTGCFITLCNIIIKCNISRNNVYIATKITLYNLKVIRNKILNYHKKSLPQAITVAAWLEKSIHCPRCTTRSVVLKFWCKGNCAKNFQSPHHLHWIFSPCLTPVSLINWLHWLNSTYPLSSL